MLARIGWSAAFAALLIASPAWAQVTLTRKLVEESEHKSKVTVKIDQKLTLGGMDAGTKGNTVVEQKISIGKRDADGKLPLATVTELKTSELTLPGGITVKFDSANPDAKGEGAGNPLYDLILDRLKTNAKTDITVILGKDNKVVEVKGLKPEAGATEDDIKGQFDEIDKSLPPKAVKKGDTWESEVKANLGQGQIMTFKRKYTYEGEAFKSTVNSTRKLEKITAVDSEVTFSVKEGGGFPGKVTKSELKVADSKHTMLFDPAQGRFVEEAAKVQVVGPIGLSIMGIDIGGDLDLTLETKSEEVN
ncbi:MAG TPA: hypothetical protein VFB96_23070 [Pirellulaceae bacterium]|nr:hypothetical protein [Pirellulaceae bacterium]